MPRVVKSTKNLWFKNLVNTSKVGYQNLFNQTGYEKFADGAFFPNAKNLFIEKYFPLVII